MDAEIAALLGTVAGAAATTGAAFATGYATREQARITARAQHLTQRREPRERGYRQLMEAGKTVREHHDQYLGNVDWPDHVPPVLEDYLREHLEVCNLVRQRWDEVVLLGPRAVTRAAEALGEANENLMRTLEIIQLINGETDGAPVRYWAEHEGAWEVFNRCLKDFIDQAQIALDDDGTQKRRFFRRPERVHR